MQVVKSPLVSQKKYSEKEAAASTSRDWDFKIKESNIKQVDFNFDNHNTAAIPKGFDYNHIKIQSLSLNAQDIRYSSVSTSGKINAFKAKEQSGLDIQSFKADFSTEKQFFFKIYT
jgi:homogentisate 1,2-dioxygenase